VQVAVDELQLIVGRDAGDGDKKQLMPMLTTRAAGGRHAHRGARGRGLCSDPNLTAIGDTRIDAYISTRKQTHHERPGPCRAARQEEEHRTE
jgi:hypothetical protein